jgi:hypothetical protein
MVDSFDGTVSQKRRPGTDQATDRADDLPNILRVCDAAVDLAHGTKDVPAYVRNPGFWSRFRSAAMVGTCCSHSNFCLELVGGISQRLVPAASNCLAFPLLPGRFGVSVSIKS